MTTHFPFVGKMLIAQFVLISFLLSCSNNKEKEISEDKFPVINPIVKDTLVTNEYVADIHSIQNVEVRARVSGYLESIHVNEGQAVKKGQLLFRLASQEYKQELSRARAMLKSATAEAKAAEVEVANVKNLFSKKIVSESEVQIAESKLDAARGKIEEAKAGESSSNLKLSFANIRAPFDGIIDRIPNKTGSLMVSC
jgi:RND family efflux transporter MFP subunit